MKNKKIAALLGILLAGSMAFSLSACGNSNDSAASDKSSAPRRFEGRRLQQGRFQRFRRFRRDPGR